VVGAFIVDQKRAVQPDLSLSGLCLRTDRQEVTVIRISSKSAWIVAALVAAVPAAGQAQVVSPLTASVENLQAPAPSTAPAPPENAEAFRFPHLIVSFGVGSSSGPEGMTAGTLQTGSVQFIMGRHFAVEAEASHWATTWDDGRPGGVISGSQGQQGFSGDYLDSGTRRGWSGGGNLLYRSELQRVSWFAGGGASVGRETEIRTSGTLGCVAPGFQYSCNPADTYENQRPAFYFRALTGADVGIAGPLRAYADVQFVTMDSTYLRASAGVRVVALTQRADTDAARSAHGRPAITAAAASGKEVRVWLASGPRPRGTLVSLTGTDLFVRQGDRDVRYPLEEVLLVETVSHGHGVRNGAIAGAIAGASSVFIVGGGCDKESCGQDYALGGAILGGIGAGAGALIGALIHRAGADTRVVYAASKPSVRVVPTITPTRAGVSLAMRW